jgi:hypothetical protein
MAAVYVQPHILVELNFGGGHFPRSHHGDPLLPPPRRRTCSNLISRIRGSLTAPSVLSWYIYSVLPRPRQPFGSCWMQLGLGLPCKLSAALVSGTPSSLDWLRNDEFPILFGRDTSDFFARIIADHGLY